MLRPPVPCMHGGHGSAAAAAAAAGPAAARKLCQRFYYPRFFLSSGKNRARDQWKQRSNGNSVLSYRGICLTAQILATALPHPARQPPRKALLTCWANVKWVKPRLVEPEKTRSSLAAGSRVLGVRRGVPGFQPSEPSPTPASQVVVVSPCCVRAGGFPNTPRCPHPHTPLVGWGCESREPCLRSETAICERSPGSPCSWRPDPSSCP